MDHNVHIFCKHIYIEYPPLVPPTTILHIYEHVVLYIVICDDYIVHTSYKKRPIYTFIIYNIIIIIIRSTARPYYCSTTNFHHYHHKTGCNNYYCRCSVISVTGMTQWSRPSYTVLGNGRLGTHVYIYIYIKHT